MTYLAGPVWHAHEMLFGFALAVIVGFLFTAGRNWTNQPTPSGPALAALACLWVAGRVLVLTPFGWAAAAVNVAFPLARGRGARDSFHQGAQPPELLLRRPAGADVGRPPAFVHLAQLGVVPPAGLGRPAARAGRRSLHRVGDGRPGDSHVHEQRRARRIGQPQAVRREGRAGAGAGVARRRCGWAQRGCRSPSWRRRPALRMRSDGRSGSPWKTLAGSAGLGAPSRLLLGAGAPGAARAGRARASSRRRRRPMR